MAKQTTEYKATLNHAPNEPARLLLHANQLFSFFIRCRAKRAIKAISTFFIQTLFIVGNRVQTIKRCKVLSFITTYLKALIVFCD